jgi:hypothetical protein
MKCRLLIVTLTTVVLGGFSSQVLARTCYPVTLPLSVYSGFDVQMRNMGFKKGYGDNTFEKQYPQGNLFVGLMFNEFFGLELGYEKTLNKSRHTSFAGGDVLLGNVAPAGTSGKFQSKGQIFGPNFNIVGIYQLCQEYPIEIFGSVGAAFLTAKFDRNLVEFMGRSVSSLRTFDREKTVWRVGAGIQYLLAGCLGFRANVGWENTSQISLYTREVLANPPQIKLQDSLLFGLGLFYIF